MLSADEGGGQRCITSMARNQNKKVTFACSRCCMQNTQTQSRLGPFDARRPQRNKTGSNCSVFHPLCTAFVFLTRSSTSGITRVQTASKNVPPAAAGPECESCTANVQQAAQSDADALLSFRRPSSIPAEAPFPLGDAGPPALQLEGNRVYFRLIETLTSRPDRQ